MTTFEYTAHRRHNGQPITITDTDLQSMARAIKQAEGWRGRVSGRVIKDVESDFGDTTGNLLLEVCGTRREWVTRYGNLKETT